MDDGKDRLTGIDRAIALALDVEPSAEFPARVRQRVARERMRVPLFRRRLFWIPAAAAAAIVVTAMLWPPAESPAPGRAVVASGPSGVESAVRGPGPHAPGRTEAPIVRVPVRRATTAPARGGRELEVLIPREEIEMYRRLIAHARTLPGAVVVEAPADLAADRAFADITIDPIAIDLIAPPEGGEGVRQ